MQQRIIAKNDPAVLVPDDIGIIPHKVELSTVYSKIPGSSHKDRTRKVQRAVDEQSAGSDNIDISRMRKTDSDVYPKNLSDRISNDQIGCISALNLKKDSDETQINQDQPLFKIPVGFHC